MFGGQEPGRPLHQKRRLRLQLKTRREAQQMTQPPQMTSSPPRSPPVLEREGGFIGSSSQQREAMTSHQRQQYRSQQQGDQVSPGSAGLIVIQPNTGLADSQSSSTSTSSMSAVSPRPASSTSPACHRRHPSTWTVSVYSHNFLDLTLFETIVYS